MMRRLLGLCALLLGLQSNGCTEKTARPEDCRTIFDRIVEIELDEMGFRDPALAARRKVDLAVRYRSQLQACVGRPISDDALGCVARAKSTEQLSHKCLR